MSPQLLNQISFKNVGKYGVAFASAVVRHREHGFALDPLPENGVKPHDAAIVGDLRLNDFIGIVKSAGLQAEFSSGILVVNGQVLVKKAGSQLVLEGTMSPTYFKVRQLMYRQLSVF